MIVLLTLSSASSSSRSWPVAIGITSSTLLVTLPIKNTRKKEMRSWENKRNSYHDTSHNIYIWSTQPLQGSSRVKQKLGFRIIPDSVVNRLEKMGNERRTFSGTLGDPTANPVALREDRAEARARDWIASLLNMVWIRLEIWIWSQATLLWLAITISFISLLRNEKWKSEGESGRRWESSSEYGGGENGWIWQLERLCYTCDEFHTGDLLFSLFYPFWRFLFKINTYLGSQPFDPCLGNRWSIWCLLMQTNVSQSHLFQISWLCAPLIFVIHWISIYS